MRLICKVGTNLLTKADFTLDTDFLENLVAQLASLKKEGHEIILVTSGAVAAGRADFAIVKEKKTIPFKQALAAAGQGILIGKYHGLFRKYGITVAQALLTNDDFAKRENFLNIQSVFELLLRAGAVPIVNENDVTAVSELTFGDNDMLSAKTASLISADLLVILTTVDGLYTDDPRKNPGASKIGIVTDIDEKIFSYAKGTPQLGSLGGMLTKVQAAKYASEAGIAVFICNGKHSNILRDAAARFAKFSIDPRKIDEFPGTFFAPKESKQQNFAKWLRVKALKNAKVFVDSGAVLALREKGKSLLPSGIRKVSGAFERGDVVAVCDLSGRVFAYGQVQYNALELDHVKGKRSSEIEKILGYAYEDEAIHRDKMVILAVN